MFSTDDSWRVNVRIFTGMNLSSDDNFFSRDIEIFQDFAEFSLGLSLTIESCSIEIVDTVLEAGRYNGFVFRVSFLLEIDNIPQRYCWDFESWVPKIAVEHVFGLQSQHIYKLSLNTLKIWTLAQEFQLIPFISTNRLEWWKKLFFFESTLMKQIWKFSGKTVENEIKIWYKSIYSHVVMLFVEL